MASPADKESADWFAALPAPARKAAARFLRRVALRREKALFYQEDPAGAAYSVVSGRIRMVKWRPDGSSFPLGRAFPGEWLGLPESVMEAPYLFDAVAETDADLTMVRSADLRYLFGIEGLGQRLARELAAGYYPLHDALENGTPERRIARELSRLLARASTGDAAAGPAEILVTQEELAEAVGLTRETVNRHLGLLAREGTISMARGRIVVVRPEALRGGT